MASPAAETPRTAQRVEIVSYPDFVDRQLHKVTRQLEVGELVTGVVRWLSVTLFAVLAVVLWDHWVTDLPLWSRVIVSLGIVGISVGQFLRHVVPPIRRRISPAYAAKMVESAEPELKNGLINLIFLRKTPAHVNEVVLRELEQQTATRLTTVDVDASVDRTSLVRWVAVLAVVIVLATAYSALVPKSLWQSVRRALNPWSPIARPSRVLLTDIEPGDCRTYYGRSVVVSAGVSRLRDEEVVWLVSSSLDGQIMDQRTEMRLGPDSRFSAVLPDDPGGATQDLEYRIAAGDARSGTFRVEVLEAPSAVIDKVHYEYPAYTQIPSDETTEGGNLEALEGTRVSWWIRTNHEVAEAFLELSPTTGPVPVPPRAGPRVPLQASGTSASGTWILQLQPDRQTPQQDSYRIRFQNLDGQWNLEPVTHRVQVLPDLTPDVEILTPATRDTQLPLNGVLKIEVRARDPDFSLSELELKGLQHGRDILAETLLAEETPGQVIKSYDLRPEQLGLTVGDMLFVWAEARDSRHDPVSQEAAPNVGRTMDYRITIVEPDERQDGSSEDGTGQPEQGGGGETEGEAGEEGAEDGASDDRGDASGDRSEEDSGGETASDREQQDEAADGEGENQQQDSQEAQGESSDQPSEAGTEQAGEQSQSSENQEGRGNNQDGQMGEQESTDGAREGSQADDRDRINGADSTAESARRDRTGASSGEPEAGEGRGENETTASKDDGASPEEPLPHDGSRDGDAFERIIDQMRRERAAEQDGQPGEEREQRPATDAESRREEPSADAGAPNRDPSRREQQATDPSADASERPDGHGAAEQDDATDDALEPGTPNGAADQQETQRTGDATTEGAADDQATDGRPSEDQPAGRETDSAGESPNAGAGGEDGPSPGGQQSERKTEQPGRAGGPGTEPRDQSDAPNRTGESDGPPAEAEAGSQDGSPASDSTDATDAESDQQTPPGQPSDQQGVNQGSGTDQQFDGADEELFDQEDPANLEYAKQATELALDYLKDQKQDPDRELLDRLGWSPDDLRRFVERWQQMREEANQSGAVGEKARNRLDQLLRGLGLVPQEDRVDQRRLANERVEGVQEEGGRSEPPADYRELYRAYLKSRQGASAAEPP